ncbi:MAG TPA: M28 family peptidase [Chthoniobacterales bacterium]|nr:M28 family peptidase [Chthoniobacterales bacterium]
MRRGRLVIGLLLFLAAAFAVWRLTAGANLKEGSDVRMPGKSFKGPPPPLTAEEEKLRDELRADVQTLAGEIGERNVQRYGQLQLAASFIEKAFADAGFNPRRDGYEVHDRWCENIEVEIPGATSEIVIIGAHYDSVFGCPGANDNGSGVAALLALARRFVGKSAPRTLRFVAFTNEEPYYFQTELMGSAVYASRCKERRENIVAMLSLETIGYYSNAPGSQVYPAPGLGLIYPTTGNFIGFVGNIASRGLVRRAIGSFRQHATLPSEGAALPAAIPGVAWSDHWAFWRQGYSAIMLTDTAPFRYPHYHESTDTPDKLDYDSMARLVSGLQHVITDLTGK